MMMGTADVTVHIDETIEHKRRAAIVNTIRGQKGVTHVTHHDAKPHLVIIKYDPDVTSSQKLLQAVLDQGVHAELIGL
jgi:hypothetical protein